MVEALALSAAPQLGGSRFAPDQYRRFANLAEAFYFNCNRNADLIAYDQAQLETGEAGVRPYLVTLQSATKDRVLRIAAQLEAWGVKPRETVAVISLNRPESTEAEMAIYTVGAVAVAIYVRVGQERLQHMLQDAGIRYAIVENEEQVKRVLRASQVGSDNSTLREILILEAEIPLQVSERGVRVTTLPGVLSEQPVREERSFAYVHTSREDLASIFYTSGSSGRPLGVPVTHGQTLENLYQIVASGLVDLARYERADATQPFVTLLLPERAHAFPARIAQLAATSPVRARYPAIVDRKSSRVSDAYRKSLGRDLREGAAGIVPVVPKILTTIEQRVRSRLAAGGWLERLALVVIDNAVRKILQDLAGTPSRITDFWHRVFGPLREGISRKIRSGVVSPHFEFFVSGGAKLPIETAAFLWALRLPVYEGYGTTETNCPVATNTPARCRLGSVGPVFSGIEARVDPTTGELWLRGPNIARQYCKPASVPGGWAAEDRGTVSAWTDDGWYRTRDIGHLDADGYLYIEDRIDNILVTWSGENVSATAIERRFLAIPQVETAVVVGHQRPGLVALVSLDEQAVRSWAAHSGRLLAEDWQQDPAIKRLLRQEIELKVNAPAVHPCERVRQFCIIDPLSPEERTLTATEKVRRVEIEHRYADQIERMYREQANWLTSCQPDLDDPLRPEPVARSGRDEPGPSLAVSEE